jgi:hypothetical protein
MSDWFDDDAYWRAAEAMMFGDAFAEAPAMVEQVLALSGVSGGDALDLCCGGERRDFALGHRLCAASELAQRCLDAGFASTEVFGGLDGRLYDEKASRPVVVARKG